MKDRIEQILVLHKALPEAKAWWARRTDAAEYAGSGYDANETRGECRWFVTAIDPKHPCWTDDLRGTAGVGVWTDNGVTTETITTFIAESFTFIPAACAEIESLKARIAELERERESKALAFPVT